MLFRSWRRGRRRSPFNNLGPHGLTCGKVTEHLYIGGELGPDDWPALRQAGVSVVINLQEEQQDIFAPDEQVEGYLWLPAPDGLSPSLEQLVLGVDFIRSCVASGQRVFVHCKAGQGRAPLLCACYLISEGDTVMGAMTKVRAARRQTLLTPEQGVSLRLFAAAYDERRQEPSVAQLNGTVPSVPDLQEKTEAAPLSTMAPDLSVPELSVMAPESSAADTQPDAQPIVVPIDY